MKARYILFAVAALAVAACSKAVEQPEPEGVQMTFRACQEGAEKTKTTVQDGGTQVFWEAADEIKVFFKGAGGRFVSQNSGLAEVADFSGTLSILVGANEGAGGANQTWGLYPYRSDAVFDGECVTTVLPAVQTGRAGSFAKNTHISLAKSGGNDLAFYNVTGGVRFSLTQTGIKSVRFQGNNGETLAGKLKLAFEGNIPAVKEVSEIETVLTLNAPGGGTFQTGQWYYIEAIPGTLSGGFKMVFSKDNETAKLSSSGSVTISRGKYGSIADADEGLIFKESAGGEDPAPSPVIQFADPIAKYACVEKFDTDGDQEVSYAEAAAATSLDGLFKDWNTVTSFDEIQYFTGVTSTWNVFNGCSNLKSITIPEFISTLGTFDGCSSLVSVVLPSGITSIPNRCFAGCAALSSIDFPSGLEIIGGSAFADCSSISAFNFPSTLASIGESAFSGCSALTSAVLPDAMTHIPYGLFQDCKSLKTITWPSAVQTIGDYAFYGCVISKDDPDASKIELPSSVKQIGSMSFWGVRHLIVPSMSPVSIASYSFQEGFTRIYVPSGMVEMYKVRTYWSNFKDQIFPVENFPVHISPVADAVDLGLSVKWASWNVGASAPEEYGEYFAWGETQPSWMYDWSTYKWCNGSYNTLTKYNTSSSYGTVDNKTVLDPEDDAAHMNWGGSWRMPTDAEWTELMTNCTWTWTSENGVNGRLVTGPNGNSIFLPAAGNGGGTGVTNAGFWGFYWSPSLNTDDPFSASIVNFNSGSVFWASDRRYYGFSVRPVSE